MVWMGFSPWLLLSIVAAVISLVWWYAIKIRLVGGYWVQLMVAWLGAWLGTPVFGKWEFLTIENVSIIPAILGSIVLIHLTIGLEKLAGKR